jgi:flagellar biogenesis protein FliO
MATQASAGRRCLNDDNNHDQKGVPMTIVGILVVIILILLVIYLFRRVA